MWHAEFGFVKIPKLDVFSRCTKCTTCKAIRDNPQVAPALRAQAIAQLEVHWKRIETERRAQEAAKNLSMSEGENIFYCEIDGMDSAKTILPHFAQWSKDVDKTKLLKIHLTCVKYNGKIPDDVYYYTDALPHDSANTITVMFKSLLKVNGMPLRALR